MLSSSYTLTTWLIVALLTCGVIFLFQALDRICERSGRSKGFDPQPGNDL